LLHFAEKEGNKTRSRTRSGRRELEMGGNGSLISRSATSTTYEKQKRANEIPFNPREERGEGRKQIDQQSPERFEDTKNQDSFSNFPQKLTTMHAFHYRSFPNLTLRDPTDTG